MAEDIAKEAFADALEVEPLFRRSVIERVCGGDTEAAERAFALLESYAEADEFMGAPTIASSAPTTGLERDGLIGSVIGRYTLRSVLGEGGFGVVFLATQTEPVARTVAVKIIKPGHLSASLAARIDAERQLLARMDHPNIAKIFDAGRTGDGRPYFVMEYVEGEAITSYCASRGLGLRERLVLMERVCGAVQHAHHKGVIHRDIKPSNVLVTEVDGVPEPRVIDFGIAKSVGAGEHEAMTELTIAGQIIGTPAYMSPEQIAGPGDLDTRSDVYSLGVLLYELLTGVVPFDHKRLREAPIGTLARIICEEEPSRPSTRASEGLDRTARRLATDLRGELDWLVLRAMEKDPGRRYQAASALGADIGRYLADEPLEAGPPSGLYRIGKFARRHRGEVIGVGIAAVALVALAGTSVVYAVNAESQREELAAQLERSEEIAAFSSGIFEGINPAVARGADRTLLLTMLEKAVARVEEVPPRFDGVAVEIHQMLGDGLYRIAAYDQAADQYRLAITHATEAYGPDNLVTLVSRFEYGQMLVEMSRYPEAKAELAAVRDGFAALLGEDGAETINTEFALAAIERLEADYPAARASFERVLARSIAVFGDQSDKTMSARNSLGTVLGNLGEFEEASAMLNTVIGYQARELGEDHPHLLSTRNNLADIYQEMGRPEEAMAILERVLETKRRVLEPEHPSTLTSLNNLASLYTRTGRADEARAMLTEAVAISRSAFGDDDRRTLVLGNNLAESLMATGDPAGAASIIEAAIPLCAQTFSSEHPLYISMLRNLTVALRDQGSHDESIARGREFVAHVDGFVPADDLLRGRTRLVLARSLMAAGLTGEAAPMAEAAYSVYSAGGEPGAERAREVAGLLAEISASLGSAADAAAWAARSAE